MFLNFTNTLISLNIYYMCVVSLSLCWLPRSGSKKGNLNWSLVPGSALGAMGNKKYLVCTLKMFPDVSSSDACLYSPDHCRIFSLIFLLVKSFSTHLLFLTWLILVIAPNLFSFLFYLWPSGPVFLCRTENKQSTLILSVPFKISNTSTKSTPVIFFLDFTLSDVLVCPQTSYLHPCHGFRLKNIFCNFCSFTWSLKSTIDRVLTHASSNCLDVLVFEITFWSSTKKSSCIFEVVCSSKMYFKVLIYLVTKSRLSYFCYALKYFF